MTRRTCEAVASDGLWATPGKRHPNNRGGPRRSRPATSAPIPPLNSCSSPVWSGSLREMMSTLPHSRATLHNREAVTDMRLARERQCVHHYRREPGARHALEKIISRGRWNARCNRRSGSPAGDRRYRGDGMIGDEHERAIAPQMLFPPDFKTAIGTQQARMTSATSERKP